MNHSSATRKKGRSSQGLVSLSPSASDIKHEIGSMLVDLKSERLHKFSLQMDIIHIKMKQEEEERALAIVFPKFTKRHPRNECPVNAIDVSSASEKTM